MVPGFKPESWLTNTPFPEPLMVKLFKMVGPGEVFQHTPRAVTGAPPFATTSPPVWAVVVVINVAGAVVIVAKTGDVTNVI